LVEKKESSTAIGPIFPAKKLSPPRLPGGYKYVCPAGKHVFYGPMTGEHYFFSIKEKVAKYR